MLQLFLVISAFSALIVAAISRQHQQALVELRGRERQLQQLIDTVPAHIWCATAKGIPSYLNKKATEVTGVTLKDLIAEDGSRSLTLIHPEDLEATDRALAVSFETGVPFVRRFRLRQANGSHRWVESRAEPLRDDFGKIIQWCGVSVDIHDLVVAQQALRDRERELSLLVEMVPSYIWQLNGKGELSFLNRRYIDFLGLDVGNIEQPSDMIPMAAAIRTLVHPDDASAVGEALGHSVATGERFSLRHRVRRADGLYRWMDSRAEPLRDDAGNIIQWYGLSHDIDDQVHAEEALRRSEQLYRALFHYMPIPLWRVNSARLVELLNEVRAKGVTDLGRYMEEHPEFQNQVIDTVVVEEVNRSTVELFGADSEAELTGSLNPYWQAGTGKLRRNLEARFRGEASYAESAKLTTRDGRVLEGLHTAVFPPALVDLGISLGSFVDDTDRIQAKEELRLAQEKMARASQVASLAELSASIAHEVNQPLAAIVANSHACQRWLASSPPNLERALITVERVIRDANSAAEVVSRIRALFNQMGRSRSPAGMAEVISEVCHLMADELAVNNVQLVADHDQSLPLVLIDRTQMQQVLVNLIRNSIEALDTVEEGKRLIWLRAVHDDSASIRVEVQDCGSGITDSERAFEPFFTTKKNGMGMGLAICRSIIESHNGRLWAASNQPRGTTLAFTLPIQARNAA